MLKSKKYIKYPDDIMTCKNNLLKHIKVNSKNTAVIQEGYMFLLHNVVRYIEDKFS